MAPSDGRESQVHPFNFTTDQQPPVSQTAGERSSGNVAIETQRLLAATEAIDGSLERLEETISPVLTNRTNKRCEEPPGQPAPVVSDLARFLSECCEKLAALADRIDSIRARCDL